MGFRVVIPVRYESPFLPGRPLLDIAGKPLVQHVYERSVESGAESVVVATDDQRVVKAVEAFGGHACMTSSEHASGTERLAEAVVAMGYDPDDIVVNVQGDEPLIPPKVIHQVAQDLTAHDNIKCATLCEPVEDVATLFNPDIVKVVMNKRGFALYFSRAPITWERGNFKRKEPLMEHVHYRHIGTYAYRVGFLEEYMEWEHCQIEKMESLEQLRILWNCGRIHVSLSKEKVPLGVDTPEDLEKVRALLEGKVVSA